MYKTRILFLCWSVLGLTLKLYAQTPASGSPCCDLADRYVELIKEKSIQVFVKDSLIQKAKNDLNRTRRQLGESERQRGILNSTLNDTKDQLNASKAENRRLDDTIVIRDQTIVQKTEFIHTLREKVVSQKDTIVLFGNRIQKKTDTITIYQELIDTFSVFLSRNTASLHGQYKPSLWSGKDRFVRISLDAKNQRPRAKRIKSLQFKIQLVLPELSPDADENIHIEFGAVSIGETPTDLTPPLPLSDYEKDHQGGWRIYEITPRNINLINSRESALSSNYNSTKLKRKTTYVYRIYLGEEDTETRRLLASGRFKTH